MIIKIKNKKDLITLDLRIRQIRYLKDRENQKEILFINLSSEDTGAYEYLFKNNEKLFLKLIRQNIFDSMGLEINEEDLDIKD